MANKFLNYTDNELQKRFPLPDAEITCPHCSKIVKLDDLTVDYPLIGQLELTGTLCPECEGEVLLNFKITINVELLSVEK